jgi:hypothetical protein
MLVPLVLEVAPAPESMEVRAQGEPQTGRHVQSRKALVQMML